MRVSKRFVGSIVLLAAVLAARSRRARRTIEHIARARDRSQLDAERVRTAAIIASDSRFDGEVHLQALLDRVAASIRPDMAFNGIFGTIDGPDAVVLARSYDGEFNEGIAVGSRIPLAETLLPEVLASGGALAFDDLRASGLLEARRFTNASGARCAIGITFRSGAKTYFLRFTADRPMAIPFDDIDRAYIELIGNLIAARLRQHAQLERLRFAMEHDLLTELPNRANLRAQIVASLTAHPGGALITFDLDRFRDVVIALGRQTADAVLVEVAVAMRLGLHPDELLGRTGGDVFAVYVAGAGRERAFDRARALIERFAQPFGTGDRDGTELVRVTASAGVALIPDDASTVDELFSRAETAVDLAKAAGRDQIAFYFRPGSDAVPGSRPTSPAAGRE